MKTCSKCNEIKDLSLYHKRADSKDGHAYHCKECESKRKTGNLKVKEYNNLYYKNNIEKEKLRSKSWQKINSEKVKIAKSQYKKLNKSKVNNENAKYRALKKKASPSWLSSIQKAQIQEFYEIATARSMQSGISYHVDHIHPLSGDGFNGLHVPWNLQILAAHENLTKHNKLEG